MFQANHLTMTYHLRDLEREFTPRLQGYRSGRTTPKFAVTAVLVIVVLVGLTLGSLPMV